MREAERLLERLGLAVVDNKPPLCADEMRTGNAKQAREMCEAAGEWKTCAHRDDADGDAWEGGELRRRYACPRAERHARSLTASKLVAYSKLPARLAALVNGSYTHYEADGFTGNSPGARIAPVPLAETEPLRVVKAWMAANDRGGQPVAVTIGRSTVTVGRGWALVLAGAVGVGKSVAAAWALSRRRGLYLAARQFEPLETPIEDWTSEPFLVLDDAGTERVGAAEWASGRIAALLEERHARNLSTLITSNLARDTFATRYGERVADRLNEGGIYFAFAGKSLRGAR